MAMTATPVYTQTPRTAFVTVSTANTNRDGSTGTYSTSLAAGANGTLIDYITFKCTGTSAAGTLRIFYSANNSTNWQLVAEVTAAGVTASGTVASEQLTWVPPGGLGFILPTSSGIKFNVNNAETWGVFMVGGDF